MSEHVGKKEEELLKSRLSELSDSAYKRGIPAYSDFLNLYEQSIYHTQKYSNYESHLYGGYALAERRIACFREENVDFYYPVVCIHIRPNNLKFSSELSHRDFLGAILNLGLERSKIGDILVHNNSAYCFVIDKIADYIIANLTRVKNTPVIAEYSDSAPEDIKPQIKEISGSVSSVRLDSILALSLNLSRSRVISYIEDGEVFVNGRLITTNSYNLQPDDIISVRHLGRFSFQGFVGTTKKGRLFVKVNKYI